MMSDNSELYERRSHLEEFKQILQDSVTYWKIPPSSDFIDSMAKKLLEYIGPYKDILKDAIRVCVDNHSTFPSIADMQKAADVVKKKPIDHIAKMQADARAKNLPGCKDCKYGGYVRMMKDGYEYTAVCDLCALGKHIANTSRLRTRTDALKEGFEKFDYDKFYGKNR